MSVDLSGRVGNVTVQQTLVDAFELASLTNVTTVTTVATKFATATRPVTTGASVVVGAQLNYIKFQTLSTSGNAVTVYVIGWTYSASASVWIPSVLCKMVVTSATAGPITVASTALYPGLTYATPTLGDAKRYNGENASCPNGFAIVDTTGCELVELHMVSSSAVAANAVFGYL
jgi:hypothetical protein